MLRSLRSLGVLTLGLALLTGCGSSGSGGGSPSAGSGTATGSGSAEPSASAGPESPAPTPTPSPESPTPTPTPTPGPESPSPTARPGDAELAGRRIVYSYPGTTVPEALLQRVRQGRVAGVIFFAENVGSDASALGTAVARLRAAEAQSPSPRTLLLMTDQEGGLVRRVPGGPAQSAKDVGRAADPVAAATRTGQEAAAALTRYGLNLNLAPVLDVYRTPGDFADSAQRSYSTDPATVGKLGSAFLKAQQDAGVAATAKHFPGLGSAPAGANTDEKPVTLDVPLNRLRAVDERPYRDAIAADVRLVMFSWAIYPELDPDHPAGMAGSIVRDELRTRLHYDGVTVTDALEAKALDSYGGTGPRALAVAHAGVDLLLCSGRDVAQGDAAAAALTAALGTGELDRDDFTASANRVDALRGTLK
ncbi:MULTISPECIES: glycoside hydrolase family 3 N-terminal domain-containing protein [Kitasatospora]|uniref:Putative glycoside hydrolase n=1 Tax=Kitasatospora setae (strain ATCC 33774 / DSM 43861 / JCM 3304 / KCC A-0304 / NBRC 14216 / KM-6054) TaxID=452652 RepID=E4N035_KITSK|nr:MULTISPECIES: glycoside hydrolase family 3 N-terminal domain-containing protein [Kitasatospora]BAJ31363.1 putative glycoside hydrolase [Kitasatospora setae KM-6054]